MNRRARSSSAIPNQGPCRCVLPLLLLATGMLPSGQLTLAADPPRRTNILLAISDDQSYPHASAYGYRTVKTPAFDRVAREGVLFTNAFAASPGCSPSRAALLTGRHPWQLEHAGTHASEFPAKYTVYPDLLETAGYHVGYTGKGWAPGNWKVSKRSRNPAGEAYQQHKLAVTAPGISSTDYAANFKEFLASRKADQPFCFWYGAHEPHRAYQTGAGREAGKKLADASLPPFLPDHPTVRSDVLDYGREIEHFDTHLGHMLRHLEEIGELAHTLVIATADNGMPFPRAKANCYEYGIHVPLAVRWGARAKPGRTVDDLVGFVDLTATILEAAGVAPPAVQPLAGQSITNILTSDKTGRVDPTRIRVFSSRERHSSSRYENRGYPQRALRTPQFLYIRNFQPDRWPAGDPQVLGDDGKPGPRHGGYCDIDPGPTCQLLTENHADPHIGPFLQLAVAKRPAEELFDISQDPGCLKNLSAEPAYRVTRDDLANQLETVLRQTKDPRVLGDGDIWETYTRYSPIRKFPAPELNQ